MEDLRVTLGSQRRGLCAFSSPQNKYPLQCKPTRGPGNLTHLKKQKQREEGNSLDLTHQAFHPQGKQQKQGAQKSQGSGSRAAAAPCGQAGACFPPGGLRRQEREQSLCGAHIQDSHSSSSCFPALPPRGPRSPGSSQAMAAHSACKNSDSHTVPKVSMPPSDWQVKKQSD